jgi:hypothetical protein
MSLTTSPVSPKATPLPPIPGDDPLTPAQWKTLLAIADAVIPAIKPMATANAKFEVPVADTAYSSAITAIKTLSPDSEADALATTYLQESASSNPAFRESLHRILALYMPQSQRNELIMVLNILE